MTIPPGGSQVYTYRPGDQINIDNNTPQAIRVKVVTACGTEALAVLHPGAHLELTVGTSPASITILGIDENYTGLRLVK